MTFFGEKHMEKEQLYVEYQPRIFQNIFSKIQNRTDTEDLTQQVFLKVYAGWNSFDREKSSVTTWIYTIARNTVTDFYRTRHVCADIMEHEDLTGDDQEPLDALINEENLQLLANALKHLNEDERDLIILHYYSGKTLTDISRSMDLPYGKVKRLHNKVLLKLRSDMKL